MISLKVLTRFLHTQRPCLAVEKSLLATLRKKTGYTFANCKKALEIHNNDIKQAEDWLRQQAQALGWSKATKLEGRQTSQGLIGVNVLHRNACLVEVNCETDFVARNEEFQKMVAEATKSCLLFTEDLPEGSDLLTKINLDGEQLKKLPASDGKSLADHLALMIGTVGENATLRRAFCLKAKQEAYLCGYAHPSDKVSGDVLLGRFGGLVALKPRDPNEDEGSLAVLGKDLCQHIVGMNPKRVGSDSDDPAKDKEDETCLIHQEYLLDDSMTVKEFLDDRNMEVVDFKRFECGENIEETEVDQPLKFVETCQ